METNHINRNNAKVDPQTFEKDQNIHVQNRHATRLIQDICRKLKEDLK